MIWATGAAIVAALQQVHSTPGWSPGPSQQSPCGWRTAAAASSTGPRPGVFVSCLSAPGHGRQAALDWDGCVRHASRFAAGSSKPSQRAGRARAPRAVDQVHSGGRASPLWRSGSGLPVSRSSRLEPARRRGCSRGAYFGQGRPLTAAALFPRQGSQSIQLPTWPAFPEMLESLSAAESNGPARSVIDSLPHRNSPPVPAPARKTNPSATRSPGWRRGGSLGWSVICRFGIPADAFAGHSYGSWWLSAASYGQSALAFSARRRPWRPVPARTPAQCSR